MANRFNHEPRRARKLLVRKTEVRKLAAAIQREGMTLIPLRLYFNAEGIAKLELGIAKARSSTTSARPKSSATGQRDKARLMRAKG